MKYFCRICGTTDPDLKHVRFFLNWYPTDSETPRIELLDPEEQTDHGIVLCSSCVCGMAAKAMEQGLIVGVKGMDNEY